MASNKFTIPLLEDENELVEGNQINSGTLFKAHRQQIKTNIVLSKSPIKTANENSSTNTTKNYAINQATNIRSDPVINRPPTVSLSTSNTFQSKTFTASTINSNKTTIINGQNVGNDNSVNKPTSRCEPVTSQTGVIQSSGSPIKPGAISKAGLLTVSSRQRGNPILKFIRNVAWEYGDIIPDYEMGKVMCALFLSLRYHNLNPKYVHERLKQLGRSYDLRVLLLQVDTKDPHHALKELAKICILSDVTLIVAFSPEEAGRYLETYKAYENKPPDLIMEKTETNFLSQFTDCVTSTRKVNKTDAMTLLTTFGSFEKMTQASEEDLSLCPGFGPQKAKRLYEVLNEPFLKANKKTKSKSEASSGEPQPSTSATS